MKILFITSRFPYPPLRGDQVIPYNRLRFLSKAHEIVLLSLYESDAELAGLDALKPFCEKIYTVRLPKWQSILNVALFGLFSQLPLQVLYYRSKKFKQVLEKLIAENNIDLIHAYLLRLAPYVAKAPGVKVLELIDSMQLNWARRAAMERIPKRCFFQEELRRVVRYEQRIGAYFDQMIVVSDKDRAFIPAENVTVVPLGIDTDYFNCTSPASTTPTIVFSGNMGYSPNINAVRWFVDKCLPVIQKEVPAASFVVAGTNPSKEIRDLAQRKGIIVTGFVESMPDILSRATVSVAPMHSGSGMQFKILEAMSCGVPVVTTTLGLGDIMAKPGEEVCLADTAETFARAVITLLNSSEMSSQMGKKARSFVVNNHSWERVSSRVDGVYSNILNGNGK